MGTDISRGPGVGMEVPVGSVEGREHIIPRVFPEAPYILGFRRESKNTACQGIKEVMVSEREVETHREKE